MPEEKSKLFYHTQRGKINSGSKKMRRKLAAGKSAEKFR